LEAAEHVGEAGKNQQEVMEILQSHGATSKENQGDICYQQRHRERSGKWWGHKDGLPSTQRPRALKQVKKMLSREQPALSRSREKLAPPESQEQLASLPSEK
jgi:hypothetical protein